METLTLTLSVEYVNIILSSLGEAPYRLAQPVIAEIQSQAQAQIQAPANDETPPPPVAQKATLVE